MINNHLELTDSVLREYAESGDPRATQLVQSLVRHLHSFIREVGLTEAEFDFAIRQISRMGQLTTASHNETRLMAGTLGVSMLVCLLNNGNNGQAETSANLLGPFWRDNSPVMANGDSIVRSETPGVPVFVNGIVIDESGKPVSGARVDVWHASPVGLYENQDPGQAEMNLRGRFETDEQGLFAFRSVRPAGYPVPVDGPVGDILNFFGRHPFRPAHLHALIHKPGFKTIASQIYSSDDPYLETDAQFGVTRTLIAHYVLHQDEAMPDGDKGDWYSLDYTFVLESGESWLPTPPISAKQNAQSIDLNVTA